MDTILDLGIRIVLAIQSLGGWLKTPMDLFSFLGTDYFFMFVLPVVYWCMETRAGMRVAFILMFSVAINTALKMTFHGPRPYWYSQAVMQLAEETSFGVPSGHSQNSFTIWGMMAASLKKGWAWVVALVVIFIIGFSRMYLGVHFPHDVLTGWLIGALLLFLVLRYWDLAAKWLKKLSFGGQVLAAFLVSLAALLINFLPWWWSNASQWQADPAWASYAGQALSLEGAFTTAGTLFGLGLGLAWLNRQGGFKTAGTWWRLILRFLVGLAGVVVLYAGLSKVFGMIAPDTEALLPFTLRYIRYLCIGAWVSGFAPWCFVRMKLAERLRA
jgi:membrane-associated phospholipid phosphatase